MMHLQDVLHFDNVEFTYLTRLLCIEKVIFRALAFLVGRETR